MPRKFKADDNIEITEAIDRYGKNKAEVKEYEDQIKADNEYIKKYAEEHKQERIEGLDYKVTVTTSNVENFNDAKLLLKIKELWDKSHKGEDNPYVKTVEIVDMEELEKAIYSGEIDAKELASCKESIPRTTLRVYKIKK